MLFALEKYFTKHDFKMKIVVFIYVLVVFIYVLQKHYCIPDSHLAVLIGICLIVDGMGREEGGGFRMGNTCIPVVDSF